MSDLPPLVGLLMLFVWFDSCKYTGVEAIGL